MSRHTPTPPANPSHASSAHRLGKVYQKVNKSVGALEYFTCNEWRFRVEQWRHLSDSQSAADRHDFPLDIRAVDWKQYLESYIRGIRVHLLRESEDSLPEARLKVKR